MPKNPYDSSAVIDDMSLFLRDKYSMDEDTAKVVSKFMIGRPGARDAYNAEDAYTDALLPSYETVKASQVKKRELDDEDARRAKAAPAKPQAPNEMYDHLRSIYGLSREDAQAAMEYINSAPGPSRLPDVGANIGPIEQYNDTSPWRYAGDLGRAAKKTWVDQVNPNGFPVATQEFMDSRPGPGPSTVDTMQRMHQRETTADQLLQKPSPRPMSTEEYIAALHQGKVHGVNDPLPPGSSIVTTHPAKRAENEKHSAIKMLQEAIMAEDEKNAQDLARGQLWGAISPLTMMGMLK